MLLTVMTSEAFDILHSPVSPAKPYYETRSLCTDYIWNNKMVLFQPMQSAALQHRLFVKENLAITEETELAYKTTALNSKI